MSKLGFLDTDLDAADELSFGDFASLQNSLTQQELLEGELSLVDPGSSVMNDGAMSPSMLTENLDASKKLFEVQEKYADAQETIRQLRHRLIRRTSVIDGIRKYYLRDVVTMKNILKELLNDEERREAWRQYECIIPSLDFKEALDLHAPEKCTFKVTPCEMCGGKLELTLKDNDEAAQLKKTLKESKEREGRWRVKLADLDAQLERALKEKAESSKSHQEEKRVLFLEMKKLREENENLRSETTMVRQHNKRLKEENEAFRKENLRLAAAANRLIAVEKELEIAKVNLEETMESNKNLKNTEKTLGKELAAARMEIKDLTNGTETLNNSMQYTQQEIKQLSSTIDRLRLTHAEVESNLGISNQNNLELSNRIAELEDSLRRGNDENGRSMENYESTIDKLRGEVKTLNKKLVDMTAEGKRSKRAMDEQSYLIEDLQKLVTSLKLDIKDLEEEIQLMEEERLEMQSLIKQKLTAQQSLQASAKNEMMYLLDRLSMMESALEEAHKAQDDGQPSHAATKEHDSVSLLQQRRSEIRHQRAQRQSQILDNEAVANLQRTQRAQREHSLPLSSSDSEGDDDYVDHRASTKHKSKHKGKGKSKTKSTSRSKARRREETSYDLNYSEEEEEEKDEDDEFMDEEMSHEASDVDEEEDEDVDGADMDRAVEEEDEDMHALEATKVAKGQPSQVHASRGKASKAKTSSKTKDSASSKTRKAPRSGSFDKDRPPRSHKSKGSKSSATGKSKTKKPSASRDPNDAAATHGVDVTADPRSDSLDPNDDRGLHDSDHEQASDDEAVREDGEYDRDGEGEEAEEAEGEDEEEASEEVKKRGIAARSSRNAKTPDRAARKEGKSKSKESKHRGESPRRTREHRRGEAKGEKGRSRNSRSQTPTDEKRRSHPDRRVKSREGRGGGSASRRDESRARRESHERREDDHEVDDVDDARDAELEELLKQMEREEEELKRESDEDKLIDSEPEDNDLAAKEVESQDPQEAARLAEEKAALLEQRQALKAAKQEALAAKRAEREAKRQELLKKKEEREAAKAARKAEKDEMRRIREAKEKEDKKIVIVHGSDKKPSTPTRVIEISDDDEEEAKDGGEEDEDVVIDVDDQGDDLDERVVAGYDRVRKPSHSSRKSSPTSVIVHKKKGRATPPSSGMGRTSRPATGQQHVAIQPGPLEGVDGAELNGGRSRTSSESLPRTLTLPQKSKSSRAVTEELRSCPGYIFLETLINNAMRPTFEDAAQQLGLDAQDLARMTEDVVQAVSLAFHYSLQTMWEAIEGNKKGLDSIQQLVSVTEDVLSCAESAILEEIEKAGAKALDTAGAAFNPSWTSQWCASSDIDSAWIQEISPSEEEASSRQYSDVFSLQTISSMADLQTRLQDYSTNANKLSSHMRDQQNEVRRCLTSLLTEWMNSRVGQIEVCVRLQDELTALQQSHGQKIVAMGKELNKTTNLYEKTMEKLRNAELKIKEYAKMEVEYRQLETKFQALQHDHEATEKKLAELTVDYHLIREEYKTYNARLILFRETSGMALSEAEDYKLCWEKIKLDKRRLEEALADQRLAYDLLQRQYSELVDREYSRLNLLHHVAMQCDPQVVEVAIQTEFLVPPMDLRTVVMEKMSRSSMRNYPQVFSQSLDQLPSLSASMALDPTLVGMMPPAMVSTPSSGVGSGYGDGRIMPLSRSAQSSRPNTFNQHINNLLAGDAASVASMTTDLSQGSGLLPHPMAQLLAPHSPPHNKYSHRINEDDLMSFLSLRLPSTGGPNVTETSDGGGFSPRSMNSGPSRASVVSNLPPSSGQSSPPLRGGGGGGGGKLIKSRWSSSTGSSMRLGKEPSEKDIRGIVVKNSHNPSPSHFSRQTSTIMRTAEEEEYDGAARGGGGRSESFFNDDTVFDTVDVSGPPSPVITERFKSVTTEAPSGTGKHTVFPEVKQIVYNQKSSGSHAESRYRTVQQTSKAQGQVGQGSGPLMITNTAPSGNGGTKSIIAGKIPSQARLGIRTDMAGQGTSSTQTSPPPRALPAIPMNSETIKKMRSELLSR